MQKCSVSTKVRQLKQTCVVNDELQYINTMKGELVTCDGSVYTCSVRVCSFTAATACSVNLNTEVAARTAANAASGSFAEKRCVSVEVNMCRWCYDDADIATSTATGLALTTIGAAAPSVALALSALLAVAQLM
jgi:hypothetical protein